MALIPIIQSSPIRSGEVGDASAWSGTPDSTTTPTTYGTYTGNVSTTFTFTAPASTQTIGTGTWSISWADTEGRTGVLPLGAVYTAGDVIQVSDGFSISFSAGTADSSETFTVAVTAANRLRSDHRQIVCDVIPVALSPRLVTNTVDDVVRTRNNDMFIGIRSITRNPSISLDYATDSERLTFGLMQHARHQVTVYENYDEGTVFLWRAASGTLPLIGEEVTYTRSGNAAYLDSRTGLYRAKDADEIRYVGGQVDRAALIDQVAITNLLPRFHATSATAAWSGTGVASFDTDFKPPLDPSDDYWNAEVLKGTQRIELDNTEAVKTETATTVAATTYVGHVLLRGVGEVSINLLTDTVDPPLNVTATTTVKLDTNTWTQYSVSGTTGAGHVNAAIELEANDGQVVCWASAAQIEAGQLASPYLQTLGSTASSNADDLVFNLRLPLPGTVSFWWYFPSGPATGNYRLFEKSSGATFSIRYDIDADVVQFFTDTTGHISSTATSWTSDSWHHIAVTYGHSSTVDGELDRAIYLDGALSNSDSSSSWNKDWGNQFEFTKAGTASGIGFRFQELRIDNGEKTAAEIGRMYDRLTVNEWKQSHYAYAGRRYRIVNTSEDWLDEANPDKVRIVAQLAQSSLDDDAVVFDR